MFLTWIAQAGRNTIDGDVDQAFLICAQFTLTQAVNQFNLDIVENVEVWQAIIQTGLEGRKLCQ